MRRYASLKADRTSGFGAGDFWGPGTNGRTTPLVNFAAVYRKVATCSDVNSPYSVPRSSALSGGSTRFLEMARAISRVS